MKIQFLLSVIFCAALFSCSQNDDELYLHNDTVSTQQLSVDLEMEVRKYQTAVRIDAQEGQDITNEVVRLKSGEIANRDIVVEIQSVGVNTTENTDLFQLNSGLIAVKKIKKGNTEENTPKAEVITLKLSKGNATRTFEILVIIASEGDVSEYTIPQKDEVSTRAAVTRASTYLGIGYDVINSKYINSDDAKVTRPVLDINKMNAANIIIQNKGTRKNYWKAEAAESVYSLYRKYTASASAKIGLGLFSGGVNVEYSNIYNSVKTNRYAKARADHYTIDEYINTSNIRSYLSDDFIMTVNNYTAAQIVNTYGTHLIVRCYQGGAAEFSYSYNGKQIESDIQMTAAINFSLGFASSNASTSTTEKINDLQKNSKLSISVIGGNSYYASNILTNFKNNYSNWVNSITNNPELVGIGEFDQCLIPLSDVIATFNSAKSQAVKTEYNNRVNEQERKLANFGMFITAINAWSDQNESNTHGYTRLVSNDLYNVSSWILDANDGAKGDFIRIGYSQNSLSSNRNAIAEIAILVGNNTPTPAGWIKVDWDLNRKAKGAFLYLIYRRVNKSDKKAIDFIGCSNTKSGISSVLRESSYTWVNYYGSSEKADLNKGAKGRFLHLSVHKTDFSW